MPISDCWPAVEASLELLDAPTHKRITSLHQHLLPRSSQIEEYASSLHPRKAPCRLITSSWTWGQSFLVYELVFEGSVGEDLEESWVARFGLPPYEGDEFFNTPEQLERKIMNEVGALRIVKERTTVPVPDIFGFSARHGQGFQRTFNTPPPNTPPTQPHSLGEDFPAFILMSAMKGKTIEDCGIPTHELGGHWDTPTSDPSYQEHFESDILKRYLASLANIHMQLSGVTFPQIGSFTLDSGSGEVRIGPMAEFGLGPFDTAEEYYAVLAEAFKRIAESAVVEEEDEEDEGQQVAISESITLPLSEIKRLRRMFAASLFPDALRPHLSPSNNHGPFPMRHGDLHSENILVDENTGEIIGIIDWEGAGTVPWEVAGALNWEVQGEVLETRRVPGLGLVRPEIHSTFNEALKDIEAEMEARSTNVNCRRRIRSTNASLRLSLAETRSSTASSLSEYATPMTSPSPASSHVSLASAPSSDSHNPTRAQAIHSPSSSPSSSNTSFTSFGNSTSDDLNSTIGSRSNLTLTSPLTSPATSIFDINRDGVDATKKGPDSTASTPKPERRGGNESGAGKLMSWFGFSRTSSEGGSRSPPPVFALQQHSPSPISPTSSHLPDLQLPTPMAQPLPTPVIEAIREPIPSHPKQSIIFSPKNANRVDSHKKAFDGDNLSLSLAAMAIAELSPSPRFVKNPVVHTPTPSPRMHARYSSMSMHRRQRSSMVLAIPQINLGAAVNEHGALTPENRSARVSPCGSPLIHSHSPMLGGSLMSPFRSRTPSPSPGGSTSSPTPNPFARPYNPNAHTRRPSSFYLPVSMNARSLSAGSTSASASPSGGSYFPPHARALSMYDARAVVEPEAPPEKELRHSVSRKDFESVLGAGVSSTPTVLTPLATSPVEAKMPEGGDRDMVTSPEPLKPSTSSDGYSVVTAPSGHTLSDLHAHAGSYVAGYLGHWMFVLACEWDTVGMALWDIVKAQKALDAAGEKGGEGLEEEEEGDDGGLEKAFMDWVTNVWAVEQAQEED